MGWAGATRCAGCGASNADRPNQFKLTGMYILPWHDVILSGGGGSSSGRAVTRQISRALAVGAAQTINLEPLGSHAPRTRSRQDRSARRQGVPLRHSRELEATVDFDNLTNANWCGRCAR